MSIAKEGKLVPVASSVDAELTFFVRLILSRDSVFLIKMVIEESQLPLLWSNSERASKEKQRPDRNVYALWYIQRCIFVTFTTSVLQPLRDSCLLHPGILLYVQDSPFSAYHTNSKNHIQILDGNTRLFVLFVIQTYKVNKIAVTSGK